MKDKPYINHINVTDPTWGADPTGIQDSTEALIKVMDEVAKTTMDAYWATYKEIEALDGDDAKHPLGVENRKESAQVCCVFPAVRPIMPVIYIPAGIYKISDSVRYTINMTKADGNEMASQFRIMGDGPEKTILRLVDHCPGFSDEQPKPMLSLMQGERSNVCMSNYVQDICLDAGSGNSGAIGLDFFSNNSGAVRNLRCVAGEKSGFAGLALGHSNYSGILLKNIETLGWDYGLHLSSKTQTMYMSAELLKIQSAKKAAVYVRDISASLRAVEARDCECALAVEGASTHVVCLDSDFQGNGPAAVAADKASLLLLNIAVKGFEAAVTYNGKDEINHVTEGSRIGHIEQAVYPRAFGCQKAEEQCVRMPVMETPEYIRETNCKAVSVLDFGAVGDGETDDTEAIQRALDSGAQEVYFPSHRYRISETIQIPSTVQWVDFCFSDLVAAAPLNQKKVSAFEIIGDSEKTLFISRLFAWEQWSGEHYTFGHASRRTLALADIHVQTLALYENSVSGGTVFMDNVAITTGVFRTYGHGKTCVFARGQNIWARQINPERGDPMLMNDGGSVWVLGFKSEDPGAAFHSKNQAHTEIYGGLLNHGGANKIAFIAEDSEHILSATSSAWGLGQYYGVAVRQVDDGDVEDLLAQSLPNRQLPDGRDDLYSLPAYFSKSLSSKRT